jgi:hypothetical protein
MTHESNVPSSAFVVCDVRSQKINLQFFFLSTSLKLARHKAINLFAAACCGYNPAAAAASTVFFSLWIAAAAIQTAATVSACSQPNTPFI